MMAQHQLDFCRSRREGCNIFAKCREASGVSRVIYLGGLGDDEDHSQNILLVVTIPDTAIEELRDISVIEFRASWV